MKNTTTARGRVMVAGGAGYIGAPLVAELLDAGYQVRIVDKLLFGAAGLEAVQDQVELVRADIRAVADEAFFGVDAVINLAGLSNDPMAEFQPEANRAMNTDGAVALARLAKRHGVRRFLQASSCSIYDRGHDAGDELLDETSPVAPKAPYAISKLHAEHQLGDLGGSGFAVTHLRKGTVYGPSPRMRYDLVVNTFVRDAVARGVLTVHHGGEMWRPLVDVRDVVAAYRALLEAPVGKIDGEVFNLVFENYRISELAHRVQAALRPRLQVDVEVSYQPGAARSYRVSGAKIDDVLGFRPSRGVEAAACELFEQIQTGCHADFANLRYYNIAWFRLLLEVEASVRAMGSVL